MPTRQQVEQKILETLTDPYGAGSDLTTDNYPGPWLYVEGTIDIPHLASDMMRLFGED